MSPVLAFLQKFPLCNGEKSWKVKEGKVPDLHKAFSSSVLFNGFPSLVWSLAGYEAIAKRMGSLRTHLCV